MLDQIFDALFKGQLTVESDDIKITLEFGDRDAGRIDSDREGIQTNPRVNDRR